MKSKVKLSTYCSVLTLIITVVLIGACVFTYSEPIGFYLILSILLIIAVFSCLYAPIGIYANENNIFVRSVLKKHTLLMQNVESVELFQPTMGAIRLCASGGYMGYWGIFKEGDIGRYAAYYGKASDCFLVRMTNGDKYVLGCENPRAMVEYIKSNIKKG